MIDPKVCVIIPTRERCDTLYHAIRSCLAQQYPNLVVLVCDNFSQDGTKAVVDGFTDSRLKYVNTGRRVSMSENWEYAISQVDADFVTVIGDDDGLIPNAISDLIGIVKETGVNIVNWKKVEYCWPNHIDPELKNYFQISLANNLTRISGEIAIDHIYRFWLGYSRGPCLYNSLVAMDSIRQVIKRDGKMFQSVSPDVYSSLALASVTKDYVISSRPFSINGASAHSGGTAIIRPELDQKTAQEFFSEIEMQGYEFSGIRGSISAAVMDALVKFREKGRVGNKPEIDFKKSFKRIIRELRGAGGHVLQQQAAYLCALAKCHGVERYVAGEIDHMATKGFGGSRPSVDTNARIDCDHAVVWADRFDVENVFDACVLADRFLGKYKQPDYIGRYSLAGLVFTKVTRRLPGLNYFLGI